MPMRSWSLPRRLQRRQTDREKRRWKTVNKSESKYFHTAAKMDEAFLELLDEKDFEYITVKEICERAGVNRSTFYLHYETVADLLNESVEYMNRRFQAYFSEENALQMIEIIPTVNKEELYLITPRYLTPYLCYVKDHKRFFRTVLKKADVLGSQHKMKLLMEYVCDPIMERYHVAKEKRHFIISFFIEGMMGVIKKWIETDCKDSVEFISEIITDCIKEPL